MASNEHREIGTLSLLVRVPNLLEGNLIENIYKMLKHILIHFSLAILLLGIHSREILAHVHKTSFPCPHIETWFVIVPKLKIPEMFIKENCLNYSTSLLWNVPQVLFKEHGRFVCTKRNTPQGGLLIREGKMIAGT